MTGRRLVTNKDEDRMVALYEEGYGLWKVGLILGWDRITVRNHLIRRGVRIRTEKADGVRPEVRKNATPNSS